MNARRPDVRPRDRTELADALITGFRRFVGSPPDYAHLVGVDKATAAKRYDPGDWRAPSLHELMRLCQARPDFYRLVLAPLFETPDDALDREIAERVTQLAALREARRLRRSRAARVD